MNSRVGVIAATITFALTVAVSGCGGEQSGNAASSDGGHGGMAHPADGGPVPAGMTAATNPKYPVGSAVKLAADHMEGMDGAKAKIVGAYNTYTYAVTFTPTTGGKPIADHKWVVQQELRDAGADRLADGTPVVLDATHMPGMKDAKATISSSTDETVYVVDYEMSGMTMTNHKWVVESEVQPAN